MATHDIRYTRTHFLYKKLTRKYSTEYRKTCREEVQDGNQ